MLHAACEGPSFPEVAQVVKLYSVLLAGSKLTLISPQSTLSQLTEAVTVNVSLIVTLISVRGEINVNPIMGIF